MKHIPKLRSGWLIVAAMFAVTTLGLTSALWTQHTAMNGGLSTGTMQVDYQHISYSDNDDASLNPGRIWAGDDAYNVLSVAVSNAYPGYVATITGDLVNVGTVPAKVTGLTADAYAPLVVTNDLPIVGTVIPAGGVVHFTLTIEVPASATELTLAEGSNPNGNDFQFSYVLDFANWTP